MSHPECSSTYEESKFDILKVKTEDFASQLTLKDLPVFKRITAEELTSGEWTNKKRDDLAPNITEFTHRFNIICIWVQRETLALEKPSKRAEMIEFFIKLVKKLLHLNNIHGAFAVISALLSQSIYRLEKTWAKVGKAEKILFEKYSKLFSSENNWERLRRFTDCRKIPCIPHLGLFLTDLMFMENAIKRKNSGFGEINSHQINRDSMLRKFASLQDSQYDDLTVITPLQRYLKNLWFDRSDLRLEEEKLYQQSIVLEPDMNSTEVSPKRPSVSYLANLSFKLKTPDSISKKIKARSLTPSVTPKFKRGHKKTFSLDTAASAANGGFSNDAFTLATDDRMANNESTETVFTKNSSMSASINDSVDCLCDDFNFKLTRNSPRSLSMFHPSSSGKTSKNRSDTDELLASSAEPVVQGVLHRFSLRSNGKTKLLNYSHRIFAQLVNNLFIMFEKRAIVFHLNSDRDLYKYKPSLVLDLKNDDWSVAPSADSEYFELSKEGHHYQFKCQSATVAQTWIRLIREAIDPDQVYYEL